VCVPNQDKYDGREKESTKLTSLVRVLHELMNREGSVVGLNDSVGDLFRWKQKDEKEERVSFGRNRGKERRKTRRCEFELTLGEGTTEKVAIIRSGYSGFPSNTHH